MDISKIANKYGVSVIRDFENCGKNSGACAGNQIFLGEFDDPEIELVSFFHELGHALSDRLVFKRGRSMSKLSCEGTAWELGLGIAYEYGHEWDYYSYVMKWARKQLRSYVDSEYDDTKQTKDRNVKEISSSRNNERQEKGYQT